MDSSRRTESLEAVRKALSTRRDAGISPSHPVNPVDLAERLGLEVRFVDIGSMEGMYFAGPPATILLPAGRPTGRQAYTCAHELGHHLFGHGSKLDALLLETAEAPVQSQEWIANAFAAYLLMPPSAVKQGFLRRGWDFRDPTPAQVLTVAHWLGVGYSALVHQMRSSLTLLKPRAAAHLLKSSPREIVRSILDDPAAGDTVLVDPAWQGRPIDIQAGVKMAVSGDCHVEGDVLVPGGSIGGWCILLADRPGQARVTIDGFWHFVRVSRRLYSGRARYRFLPEPNDGNDTD